MMDGRALAGSILIAGSSNTDLVCRTDRLPRPGETVASTSFDVYPGGKAANQAVAAARSGARVYFVGALGDDEYGAARRLELEAEGIRTGHLRTIPGETSGLALIAVDDSGENLIITVAGANDRVRVDELDAAIEESSPSVTLFPHEAPWPVVERLTSYPAGSTKILNAAPYADRLRELVGSIDILICNEIEASGFAGYDVSAANCEEAVRELASLARRAAIITLGEFGAVACEQLSTFSVRAPKVPVVDTTGAGDAFCGAFAAWLAAGESLERAVNAGVVAGALAVTRAGAQPSLPRREEIITGLSRRV